MKNQAPTRIGYERGFDGRFNDKVARTMDWLGPGVRSMGRARPRPRVSSVEQRFTETSRPRPCSLTFLKASWLGPADLLSTLLDGLFELLL